MEFIDFVINKGILTSGDKVSIDAQPGSGKELEDILILKGVSRNDILSLKSEYYRVPGKLIELDGISKELESLIPEKSIEYYRILALNKQNGVLEVGMVNPDDQGARDAIDFIGLKEHLPYKIFVITLADFNGTRTISEKLESEVGEVLVDLEGELTEKTREAAKQEGGEKMTRIVEDAPVTKIVATILRYATEGKASDIHIEPLDTSVRVRFRIDGAMHTSLTLPKDVENAVVARIKILCSMKLDEKRKPQDGRFSAHIDGSKIDFRVSTFPTYYGEKVVMRLLNSSASLLKLDEIGMSERNLNLIKKGIELPYGLVLISGPTGSGKTTTLYAMLNELDRDKQNVLSLEDPVEYNIPGISQSAVRPEIGYTFANGLRTTLRQDPDVIMVGEIRDKETAQLAIQAALTGHLVLSTIHTNSAIGVIPRLIDMGIDPYLIAPTLRLVIAQRLVRKLCPGAGREVPVRGSVKEILTSSFSDLPQEYRTHINVPPFVMESAPSAECPNGTRGRMAVIESFWVTPEIEETILRSPTEPEVYSVARKQGMFTMREDAILKTFERKVPFEEINTV